MSAAGKALFARAKKIAAELIEEDPVMAMATVVTITGIVSRQLLNEQQFEEFLRDLPRMLGDSPKGKFL